MPIREKGYYNWEGELETSHIKWLPIFLNGIKSVYKKRFSKLLFVCCAVNFLVFLVMLYVSTRPEFKMLPQQVKEIQSNAFFFNSYYTNGFLIFMMVIMAIFAGGDSISGDLKHKSFVFYLSRPLSRLDYLKGKFSIVLFYLLAFTLAPGLLLVIIKMIFSGEFSVPPNIILATIILPIVMSLFLSSLTLMLSSLSSNGRFVKVSIFMAYLMSNALGQMFHGVFRDTTFLYLSLDSNLKNFGKFLFGGQGQFYTFGFVAGCILVGLSILFFAIVMIRIKRVEV